MRILLKRLKIPTQVSFQTRSQTTATFLGCLKLLTGRLDPPHPANGHSFDTGSGAKQDLLPVTNRHEACVMVKNVYNNTLTDIFGKGTADMPESSDRGTSTPVELHFTLTNGVVDDAIEQLMDKVGGIAHTDIVREIILAGLKAGQENSGQADLKLMNSSLKEMRFTAKVFGPYREVRKVTVFGSARTRPDAPLYHMATALGKKLADAGFMVITGGGPGIMQAANEGAGSEHSFGVNIRLPFEQKPNPVLVGNPRHITYKYFFNRKVAFLKEADAVVLFPGGFGTLDEAMESITLLQTGKRYPLPLIFVDEPGGTYWERLRQFLEKELSGQGYISRDDYRLIETVNRPEDAVDRIRHFYYRYHSLRYVGDQLVIRLASHLEPDQVAVLKSDYADILLPDGDMYLSGPLSDEINEPELADLPRLVVDFNKRDFGRLKQLVDDINAL